jgi:hypothetical protein
MVMIDGHCEAQSYSIPSSKFWSRD